MRTPFALIPLSGWSVCGCLHDNLLNYLRNCLFILFILFILFSDTLQAASADYLISLVRHGDRSPRELGNQSEFWPDGAGQLTSQGREQMYLLGQAIRKQFFADNLPGIWTPKLSRHFAKGHDRTVQSASSLLQGFYPAGKAETGLPGAIQLPPVYSTPLFQDYLFSAPHICPGYKMLIEKMQNSPVWQAKKKQYNDKLEHWAGVADSEAEIYDLVWLMDRTSIHAAHGLPLAKGLTENDALELRELLDWVLAQIGESKAISQLVATPLINTIIRDLQTVAACHRATGSENCQRWTLYMASDINLLTLMGLLGVPRETNVSYASHLEIRLDWHAYDPRISLFFNGDRLPIPRCGDQCSLDKWLQIIDEMLPDNWGKLCAGDQAFNVKPDKSGERSELSRQMPEFNSSN